MIIEKQKVKKEISMSDLIYVFLIAKRKMRISGWEKKNHDCEPFSCN